MGADDRVSRCAQQCRCRCLAGALFQQFRTAAPVDRRIQSDGFRLQHSTLAAVVRDYRRTLFCGLAGIVGVDVRLDDVQPVCAVVRNNAAAVHKGNFQISFRHLIRANAAQQQDAGAKHSHQQRQQDLRPQRQRQSGCSFLFHTRRLTISCCGRGRCPVRLPPGQLRRRRSAPERYTGYRSPLPYCQRWTRPPGCRLRHGR